ncbi:MAG: DUF523 domain-containing protein [Eubacteriales bacterium]|nr:DUF523 domain-containing protein [Eubacteriales bacterium]MDD3199066.1 DUF523 domain-containing protein [Eubacteriales bacterium]MDD4122620.1 DUF523 domain-containing protein [Eubacteriales bacterium]MDD4629448.1 DUF523 domain-containing protein [Eubacteriales bacterium]
MYLISACLAGVNCKYNGSNNECGWIKDLMKDKECLLVCPEELGKLSTPRPPSEIINGKAIDKNGKNVTDNLIYGAEKALEKAEKRAAELGQEIELAILKSNSPSCGSGKIYDGTFTGTLIDGDGIFAEILKKKGITVITEKQEDYK